MSEPEPLAVLEIPAGKHGFLVGKFWAFAFPTLQSELEVHGITLDMRIDSPDLGVGSAALGVLDSWRAMSCLRFVVDGAGQLTITSDEVPSTPPPFLHPETGEPERIRVRDVTVAGRPLVGSDWRVALLVMDMGWGEGPSPCTTVLKLWGRL